jgi:predicted RNA-binding protein Jag
MILQLPFLWAFYKVLSVAIEMRGSHWLWVTDLSQPESLAIHLLPILLVVTQFAMQRMTPQPGVDPAQAKMMMFMPLMFGYMFYFASAGLVLYWLTGNVVGIVQQWLLNKTMPAAPVTAPAPIKKGRKKTLAQKKYTVADTGPRIDEFLKNVFKLAGFQLAFTVAEGETPHPDFENPDLMVRFTGADVDLLLGNKAELLLALEQLTMEAIGMAPEEHSRICFDANDRRILRIEELRMSAQAASERVKKSRQPFHFSPMNSRERRILHLALRDETDVRSESVGEGPIRQVVIVPAEMKTLPEPVIPPKPRPELDSTGGRPGGFRDRGRGGRDGDRRGGPPSRGGPRGPRRDHR